MRTVLIDTWWNVNEASARRKHLSLLVLIDTWWNVNDDQILINQGAHVVLIDTWWNVNKDHRIAISNQNKGFNRYMVECE